MAQAITEFRQQFLPEIDHRIAILTAYQNCLNSFQGLESETTSVQGIMESSSHVSTDRFCYNMMILDGMIEGDKDEQFHKDGPYKTLVDLLEHENKEESMGPVFRYWARLDALMRRQGMFTTPKKDLGHL